MQYIQYLIIIVILLIIALSIVKTKKKDYRIIVSVTGIFIVLLALVGITFAYFIAQIQGNENSTSVSVVTANLKLIYAEDTNEIQGINNALPGYKVTKTFAAINVGNNKVNYVVTLENIELVNKEAIQKLGAQGIVEIDNQLKIILGEDAKQIKKYINDLK